MEQESNLLNSRLRVLMSAYDCRIEQACEHPMASASTHTGTSTSSTSVYRRKYEVFLSFRGADTRHGFTDHLYAALENKGIVVFRDDEELGRGEEIHPALKDAIKASQYAVVVISEKFAESKSCLFELTVIMECWRAKRLTVFPVFYHVDPSDVRNQEGAFGKAFAKLQNDPKVGTVKRESWKAILNDIGHFSLNSFKVDEDPLNSCRDALRKVGNLSGWHVEARPEAKVVEEISSKIFHMLTGISPNTSTPPVGIESQATEVLKLLDIQAIDVEAKGVGVIGIYGMGGVGKTTLAEVIYDSVFSQFQAQCFITIKKGEIVNLKRKLIYGILSPKAADSLKDDFEVARTLHNRLRNIRSFIVLDNVDNKEEVEALIGNTTWFGGGSRIILISRDSHLLKLFDAKIYTVNELEFADALQLFSLNAFKQAYPKKHFEELSTAFVEYAKGLPLALKVLGSFLYGRPKNHWECYKERLEACFDKEILSTLEISFEGLGSLQKELFLDIAYFFNGFSIRTVIPVLESFGFKLIDLDILVEKSMLKITENGELLMHDLLVRLGQDLDGRRKDGKCKRLWRSEDIIQGSGTKGVIAVNHAKKRALCFDTISNMRYLRMLKIVYPDRDFEGAVWYGNRLESKLTNNFRLLEWFKFPFLYLSPDSQPQNLIKLKLPDGSTEQLQFEFEMFHFLTQIDLSGSKNLTKTSDLPQVRDLKIADLSPRENLIQVDSPLGSHNRVRRVELHFSKIPGRSSNLASNCSSDQSSSEMLNLFDCRLPNEAVSGYLSGLYSFKSLLQRWKKFTRIPDEILQLFALGELPLGELHLGELLNFHEFTHSSLSSFWLFSSSQGLQLTLLKSLTLNFVDPPYQQIPYQINNLPSLTYFDLRKNYSTKVLHCLLNTKVLPKLPMTLGCLDLTCCLLVKVISMDTWNLNAISSSIFCPTVVGSIGYDGKAYKILFLHPQYPLCSSWRLNKIEDTVACGPVLEAGFAKWFNERCTNFFGIFKRRIYLDLDDYLEEQMGYALYIIYQAYDNPSFPIFICELEIDGYDVGVPLVFCVPELPSVGVNMAWVFIPAAWFNKQVNTFNAGGILRASIATKSLNVKVNECWTRVVWKYDVSGFYDALSSIYDPRVDLESLQDLFSNLGPLYVYGGINYEVSKIGDTIECGSVPGARIPNWFSGRSTNLFGKFRSSVYLNLDDYVKGWMGYALYIVYESCDGWPIFQWELEVDGYRVCLGVRVARNFCEFPRDRLNGAWVFITAAEFKKLKSQNTSGILRASIATRGLNVKVTGCWTREVWKHDVSSFYDALRSVNACPCGLRRLQELLPNMGTLSVLAPDEEKSSQPNNVVIVDDNDDNIGLANDDEIVETQQLEIPRCQDMTDKENQTQEVDMLACLDACLRHGNQSLESIHLERSLNTVRDSTIEENQPKSPIALPRQEHLEMAELTDQDRSPHRVRRHFRVQRRRQVKRRRRHLPLQRDPSVGHRNDFVSSWQFWRSQFFLHGRRNSLAAVCLLFTAFALLVFPSWKISDLENELCPT